MRDQPPLAAWHRLAGLLIARRIKLGFRRREDFAARCGPKSLRLIDDLEDVRRTRFRKSTLARAETYYQWMPHSIETVLDFGDPTPWEPRPGEQLRHVDDFSDDELLVELGRRIAAKDPRLVHLVAHLAD